MPGLYPTAQAKPKKPDAVFPFLLTSLNALLIYPADMSTEEYYTGPEIAEMIRLPAVYSYAPDGCVQLEKCGLIGFGLNVKLHFQRFYSGQIASVISRSAKSSNFCFAFGPS
jgi:hypothetical protein